MYYGEATTALDDKGRITVPVHLRSVMDQEDHWTWFVTRGFDNALFMFPKALWDQILRQTGQGNPLDPAMLDFRRLLIGSVTPVKRDNQGRMVIPAALREFAKIQGEAVLLGVEDHLELWSTETWRAFQERQAEQYKAMAGQLFGQLAGQKNTTQEGSNHDRN
jgi:MraZ protein